MKPCTDYRSATVTLTAVFLALLSGCGGGSSSSTSTPAALPDPNCLVEFQQTWLRDYMQASYFWSGAAPNPAPSGEATLQAYFNALLFTGAAPVPRDRWSYISDSASYKQFFEEGKTLGYGLAVNGLEAKLPLKVRYIEANSPAAAAGLMRGDVIKAINGVSDANLFAGGNFSALTPAQTGDTILIQIESASGLRSVTVTAGTYTLKPVSTSSVLTLSNGSKVGYLVLKDFITQAQAPLATAFADFRQSGAREVILDLRYNGGGRVSTANVLASLVAGSAQHGKTFTQLIYSAKQSSSNTSYALSSSSPGFSRVVILTGQRTCSASELLANGLKPYLEVVTIGATTCGKPFGFNPTDICSKTISAVNFESLNANNAGRYYDGLAPTCRVSEDFSGQLGDTTEILTAAAISYLQSGFCPVSAARLGALLPESLARKPIIEPNEYQGMRAD